MDVTDILYAKNKFGGGGGTSGNYVEVIEGTLANPWGEVNIPDFYNALYIGNANATLNATLGEQTVLMNLRTELGYLVAAYALVDDTVSTSACAMAVWDWSNIPNITSARLLMGGDVTNLIDMANAVPTTLTIYWHPMPSA